eukprot:scaffold133_cov169-Amphora_coffeaeformis.AAC.7
MSRNMTTMKPKPKRGRPPKPKDAPCRPLSAYNIFFRDERQRILARIKLGDAVEDYVANSAEAIASLQGKKTGVIKFQAIARTIATRWKALSEDERSPYEAMAAKEMDGYKKKKEEYMKKVDEPAVLNPNVKCLSNPVPQESSCNVEMSLSGGVNFHLEETPCTVVGRGFARQQVSPVKPEKSDLSKELAPSLLLLSRSHPISSPGQGNKMAGTEKSSMLGLAAFHHSSLLQRVANSGSEELDVLLVRREQEIRRREQVLLLAEEAQRQRRIWQALTLQQQDQKKSMRVPRQQEQQQLLRLRLATMQDEREQKLRSRFALQQKLEQLQRQELQTRLALQHRSW